MLQHTEPVFTGWIVIKNSSTVHDLVIGRYVCLVFDDGGEVHTISVPCVASLTDTMDVLPSLQKNGRASLLMCLMDGSWRKMIKS